MSGFARVLRAALGAALGFACGYVRAEAAPPPQDRAEVAARIRGELAAAEARMRAFPDSAGPRLDRLRLAYALGVARETYLEAAERETDWLAGHAGGDPARANLARAYRGAILVAHAKHGFHPKRKLRLLQAGGPLLDSAVAAGPEDAEVRYLRLVSGYYLPFFLGRKAAVREDFAALSRILPEVTGKFPLRFYLSVAGFVKDKGNLDAEARERLSRGMAAAEAAAAEERSAREGGNLPRRRGSNRWRPAALKRFSDPCGASCWMTCRC